MRKRQPIRISTPAIPMSKLVEEGQVEGLERLVTGNPVLIDLERPRQVGRLSV